MAGQSLDVKSLVRLLRVSILNIVYKALSVVHGLYLRVLPSLYSDRIYIGRKDESIVLGVSEQETSERIDVTAIP